MYLKLSILYSWFVRTFLFFLPDYPFFMRFRGFLYSFMMKECGRNFQVSASATFNSLSEICVGNNVYIAYNTVFITKKMIIEDNVLFGPNCVISGGNHQFDGESFRFLPSKSDIVIIKKGSWISANCTLLSGSVFPSKSILAAGSVLTKSFARETSIYGGVPAKYIKQHC